ncbi:unnamed protein product [Calypogeia fissa]
MEGTKEETRLLEERRSLLSSQREGSPMAHVFRSNFFLLIGLCSILGLVWLGCRNDIFDAIWSHCQVERSEYHDLRTGWQDREVSISIAENALESGAVCLDGSPPAYFLDRGSGKGANNWVLFHQGELGATMLMIVFNVHIHRWVHPRRCHAVQGWEASSAALLMTTQIFTTGTGYI